MLTPSAAINLVVATAIAICLALILLALNQRQIREVPNETIKRAAYCVV